MTEFRRAQPGRRAVRYHDLSSGGRNTGSKGEQQGAHR